MRVYHQADGARLMQAAARSLALVLSAKPSITIAASAVTKAMGDLAAALNLSIADDGGPARRSSAAWHWLEQGQIVSLRVDFISV